MLPVEESEKKRKKERKKRERFQNFREKAVCTIDFFFNDLRTGADLVTQSRQQISGRQNKCTPNATHKTCISRQAILYEGFRPCYIAIKQYK